MGREDYSKVRGMVEPAFDWSVDSSDIETAFGEAVGERIHAEWTRRIGSELGIVADKEWPFGAGGLTDAEDFMSAMKILSETIRKHGGDDVVFVDAVFTVVDDTGNIVDRSMAAGKNFGLSMTSRWIVGPEKAVCLNESDSPAPRNRVYALRRAMADAVGRERADELLKDMIDHVGADIDASMRQRERM